MPPAGLRVHGGRGDDHGVFRRERGRDGKGSNRQRADGGSAKRKTAELVTGHGISSWEAVERQFRAASRVSQSLTSPDAPRYGLAPVLLRPDAHEFVNKRLVCKALSAEKTPLRHPSRTLHHHAQPLRRARDAGVEPARAAVLECKAFVEQHDVVPLRALRSCARSARSRSRIRHRACAAPTGSSRCRRRSNRRAPKPWSPCDRNPRRATAAW